MMPSSRSKKDKHPEEHNSWSIGRLINISHQPKYRGTPHGALVPLLTLAW
ncbi:MAG: hypothetical protein QNJ41_27850 [Xenococcaceae cyanobacterium MO_188.B32]|nr:hypothetical protein [Xenococcaceae cyanobacterium MO_188.B32]